MDPMRYSIPFLLALVCGCGSSGAHGSIGQADDTSPDSGQGPYEGFVQLFNNAQRTAAPQDLPTLDVALNAPNCQMSRQADETTIPVALGSMTFADGSPILPPQRVVGPVTTDVAWTSVGNLQSNSMVWFDGSYRFDSTWTTPGQSPTVTNYYSYSGTLKKADDGSVVFQGYEIVHYADSSDNSDHTIHSGNIAGICSTSP